MNEVSSKMFEIFLGPLARKGVPVSSIVAGTAVPVEKLFDKKQRVDWSDFVVVMRNIGKTFSNEELVDIGRTLMHAPGLRFALVVARLAMTPIDLYRWLNKPREGVGNQMFTCIVPSYQELSPSEIVVDLTVREGYEVCWEFHVVTAGTNEEIPSLFGLPPAQVALTRIPRGGRMHITIPTSRPPLLVRGARALSWPFTARAAARELKDAHETLVDRYREIEDARSKLDHQAAQLRIAHSVNVLVQRDVDLDGTLKTIAKALVEEAGFAWAKIAMAAGSAEFGERSDAPAIHRMLEGRGGERVGELSVIGKPGTDRNEHEELLSFITPSLAIALHNAIYRDELERRVDERTHELRQARDALAGTVEQLREAQGARERFFGNISHEIRTPLSIVLLAVGDIERRVGDRLDARARGSLGSIGDAVRKLVRLVDELLLLAAGQEGKLVVQPEPTNLGSLIESIANAWLPAAEAAGLSLSVRIVPLVASVDPIAIERAVTNLVSNAVKYTPAGGTVELVLARDSEHVCISVLDTGPGIPEDLAPRLFGRFERAEQHRHLVSGTGIGLAIVKQLVDAHGGTIAAHARPSGGTEMRIELPATVATSEPDRTIGRRSVTEPPPVAAASAPPQLAVPNALSKGSILIAEDDRRLADMLAELLSDEFVVRVANDGATALEIAKRHQPQLLITDVDMPGINGIELASRFREVTNDRLAPVVILSAVLDLGTRVAALEAGAVDYVTKPFDPAELRARVRAQFRMRDLAIRLHRAEQLSTLGVLTSGLAHELRNPANGVVNAVEPLRQLLPPELVRPDQPVGQLLEVIGECADQINTLSRQLLGFKSSATELAMRSIRLQDLVQRALSISQEAFKDVTVKVRVPGDLMFDCAPPLLVQVLTNLLDNAAQAAGRGGWVDVVARVSGELVSVEVSDSGPGVPTELRTKVFEPFFTTKPAGSGSGLGLAVSREIVARHGGSIAIEDQGERSAFVVRLPLRAQPRLTVTEKQAPRSGSLR